MRVGMSFEEFDTLAGAWGADIARWPAERRSAAEALAASSPEAAATLAEAARLDRAIVALRPAVSQARSADLVGRVAVAVAGQVRQDAERAQARRLWKGWFMPVTSLASAAVVGVVLGLAQPLSPPMSGAEYITALVIDGNVSVNPWMPR